MFYHTAAAGTVSANDNCNKHAWQKVSELEQTKAGERIKSDGQAGMANACIGV